MCVKLYLSEYGHDFFYNVVEFLVVGLCGTDMSMHFQYT